MPHSQHLQPQTPSSGEIREGYRWLSAHGAAAISLLLLYTSTPREIFGGSLAEVADIPLQVWLKDADGNILDEVMACAAESGLLLTCHGGAAVRRAVESELQRAGLKVLAEEPRGFTARTLALLPQACGLAAVRLILKAASQEEALRAAIQHPATIPTLLEESSGVRYLFEPPRIQLWGPVNAGKSSLLNALCGRTLAAIGDEPGLTRDLIEGRIQHEGFELRLFDAPGTWAEAGGVDAEAQQLARRWLDEAELVIELVPPGAGRQLTHAVAVHSRTDESGAEGVSIHDVGSLNDLKDRLVEYVFGRLRGLPPERCFAVHPNLRADLQKLADGAITAAELAKAWLD